MNSYYVISALTESDVKVVLGYDVDEDMYFWLRPSTDMILLLRNKHLARFTELETAEDIINKRHEFNLVGKDLTTYKILLPECLIGIAKNSVSINQIVEFDEVKPVDLSSIYDEFETKKALFEQKMEELKNI